jgi:hypothetical protein
VDPGTWTGQAIGGAVWWALTRLLTTTEFWAGLVATLLGVFLAFRLERWRERRHAVELYARSLSAVRYESALLHSICRQALVSIAKSGGLTSYELEAPALRDFVASPSLQEHGPHRLSILLGSVLAFLGAARNSLHYFRSQVPLGGTPILTAHLGPLTQHLVRLQTGIEHAQTLMDQELQRLRWGVRKTAEDQRVIDAFTAATK